MSDLSDQLRAAVAQKQPADPSPKKNLSAMQRQAAVQLATDQRHAAADAAARAPVDEVFAPQLAEFMEVLESSGVLHDGQLKEQHAGSMRPDAGTHRLIYAAAGQGAYARFQVRLAARAVLSSATEAAIELSSIDLCGECLRNGQPDVMGRTTWQAIVELPRFRAPAGPAAADAARQWCEDVLKRSAAALMEANFGPAAPAFAPVAAPAVFDSMPVTM